MRAPVKCSAMRARAARPNAARRSGSRPRAPTPSSSAAGTPNGTERQLAALAHRLRARPLEAREVHALPEDVHLARRPEAFLHVPARRTVRDHDARIDRAPGEAVDPARTVELVRGAEKERDPAARAG